MEYLVYNSNLTKGIIINAIDADQARKKAFHAFYGAFSSFFNNDFTNIQAYNKGKNHPFNNANGVKIFDRVQFSFSGEGAGVTTQYNKSIDIEPTNEQVKFIGNSKIDFVKFWNGDYLKK